MAIMPWSIRTATAADFDELYRLGLDTPEIQVSATSVFMEHAEFLSAIESSRTIFLLAEVPEEIVGFIYVNTQDLDRAPDTKLACLVYLVVRPEYRRQGVAQALYEACVSALKACGHRYLYVWATLGGDQGMIKFMGQNGFQAGHPYLWMDREL